MKNEDDLFWEEFESNFDDYAARSQSSTEQLEEEKRFAEQLLGRE